MLKQHKLPANDQIYPLKCFSNIKYLRLQMVLLKQLQVIYSA